MAYLGPMTKIQGDATKLSSGIYAALSDSTGGRRSVRWLADRSGIPYSTLQHKLSKRPGRLNTDEIFRIADALGVKPGDLYSEDVAA